MPSHVAAFVLSRPSSLCSPPVLPCSAGVPLRDFSAINGLSATSDASCYLFQPFPSTIPLGTMASADFSRQALLRRSEWNGVRETSSGKKHALSPHAAASFTPTAPCSCRTSLCLASLSAVVCLMRFLFISSRVCLQLLSAYASRRTPCFWL